MSAGNVEQNEQGLLRIGTFSMLSRVSVRMLRHYQQHGVLMPAAIDEWTGHRLYRADQLEQARWIVLLRDAGFPVATIARLVSRDGAAIADAIHVRREELTREQRELQTQLMILDRIETMLRGRPNMTDVEITTIPEMTVAGLRRTLPSYADEGQLWQQIMPLLGADDAAFPAGGLAGATFHDPDFREHDVDVEIWIQVVAPFEATPPLACETLSERRVVTTTLRGDYSQMGAATQAIGAVIAEQRLRTGAMFNIYRVGPAQTPDPSAWVTQVCFPILD